ncbi:choice-of-anchor D domain-containing protein [Rhodoblastus sp.]|uniref:choice-of-anchor D domain-containing protein n=1 Tax=Rhodoblastus sp. TaxID=1962975 RepID=UPI003F9D9252
MLTRVSNFPRGRTVAFVAALGLGVGLMPDGQATPLALDYSIFSGPSSGEYTYDFSLILNNNDRSWIPGQNFNGIIFGDQPFPGPSNLTDFSINPTSFPVGPFTNLLVASLDHNGPIFLESGPFSFGPGWVPSAVGDTLAWSGTSTAFLPQGQLLFSNLLGTGVLANFAVADLVSRLGLASPTINNAPINFGAVRIGSTVANQAISVSNTAPIATTTELLDGSVVSAPTGFTASGSFTGLAAGAPPNTSIQVGMNTSMAGAHSGNVALNFVSDGTSIPGDGTTTNLGNTNVAVSGAVYRLANPTLNTTSVTLAARVGGAAPSANVSVTNASPDQYTESLKASFGPAPAGFTNTGAIVGNGLVAGNTDNTSLSVGLASTAMSGTITGSATVNFVTTGAGTDNAPDMSVGGGTVALTGNVYQTAAAEVTPSVNFGVVHVGATVANQSVTVTNTATGALTDVITGGFGPPAPGSPFSTSGNLGSGVVGNGGSSNALQVGLDTSKAGVFGGSAALSLASHDSDLPDLALTVSPVALTAQVNNYAVAGFGKTSGSGSLRAVGTDYVLDFRAVKKGSAVVMSTVFAGNLASGPSDLLDGSFSIASGGGEFGLSGFNPFSGLDAGQETAPLGVSLDTSSLGSYTETIDLTGTGYYNNATYAPYAVDAVLTIEGTVINTGVVPEPSIWAMMLLGFACLGYRGYRKTRLAIPMT